MPLIGDFVAGAGAVGAQMSMDALKSTIEEERATRLAEMQNKFQVARDASEQGFRRGERVAGQDFQTSTAATTRANALEDAPRLAGVRTDAEVDGERRKRLLPPAPISEEDKRLKGAQAGYYESVSDRAKAEAEATRDGTRYRRTGGAVGAPQSEKDAKVASSEMITLLKGEKDAEGRPIHDSRAIMQYASFAAGLVRSGGYSPQEAAVIARSAPIRTQADINAQLVEEEKKLPKVGIIRGAMTGGGVEGGDVEVNGKTMKLDEWRKQRGAQIMADNDKELAGWAEKNGIQLGGPKQPSNGAPYPDGTVLEKDGKKYEVRNGQPVEMGGEAPLVEKPGIIGEKPKAAKFGSADARADDEEKRRIAAKRRADAEERERKDKEKSAERNRERDDAARRWNSVMAPRNPRRPVADD